MGSICLGAGAQLVKNITPATKMAATVLFAIIPLSNLWHVSGLIFML